MLIENKKQEHHGKLRAIKDNQQALAKKKRDGVDFMLDNWSLKKEEIQGEAELSIGSENSKNRELVT